VGAAARRLRRRAGKETFRKCSTNEPAVLVSDSTFDAERLRRQLAGLLDVHFVDLAGILRSKPGPFTVVSAKFSNASHLLDLKEWVKSKPKGGKVIFATRPGSRHEQTQAYALGATDVVNSPIDAKELLQKIWSDFAAATRPSSPRKAMSARRQRMTVCSRFSPSAAVARWTRPRSRRRAQRSSTKSNPRACRPGSIPSASTTARPISTV
jgi:CheY-like chemotaxis protein